MTDWQDNPDQPTPTSDAESAPATPRNDLTAAYQRVQKLAADLADAVQTIPVQAGIMLPPFRLPRLQLPYEQVEEVEPDPRHLTISVRTAPLPGAGAETHLFSDRQGLTYQTYGAEHDFSQDRTLDIQNSEGVVIASYPPGTWLDACYPTYRSQGATDA